MPPKAAGGLAGTSAKRLAREINDLKKGELPQGCVCQPGDENMWEWTASIEGPPGSPYEGGVFHLAISLPADYPFRPPRVAFNTRVYHCNINAQGAVCLDILKGAWSPALSIVKVLLSLASLLADPNPHDPLVPDIAQRYLKDRKGHDQTAKDWTTKYAKPKSTKSAAEGSSKTPKAIEVITIDD
ncbi:ubiquitin-conjugating enzyme e2-16kda [Pseudohyphozyma bogoriensis]|nr:ubiquitin-conjugating enzyme e2-16kda [Pseudohyphozyma bogoriensis]